MEQMTLSEICKKFDFTRRVIQGYEKEGLIKHSSKNKFGHLMYDEKQVKKIAYIRYLQINGLTLKEISKYVRKHPNVFITKEILEISNSKHKEEVSKLSKLIKRNNQIIKLYLDKNSKRKNKEYEIIMEEILK